MTDGHTALLYRGAVEYLAAVVPFVREGVLAGEAVTVVAPVDNLALVRDGCAAEGLAEQVRWLDMAEVGRNPGRIVPAVLHPLLGRGARVVTEVVWPGRSSAEYASCVRHEALANRLLHGQPLRLLCPYDAQGLRPVALADALTTHPGVLERGGRRPSPGYAPQVALDTYNNALLVPQDAATLAVGVAELGAARTLVSGRARAAGLTSGQVGDVALVVTELVTNSIEHGGGRAGLAVWATDTELVCEIRDDGVLGDPLAGLRPAPADQPHGRGLLLVHTLADLVTITTDDTGTAIRAHFSRVGRA